MTSNIASLGRLQRRRAREGKRNSGKWHDGWNGVYALCSYYIFRSLRCTTVGRITSKRWILDPFRAPTLVPRNTWKPHAGPSGNKGGFRNVIRPLRQAAISQRPSDRPPAQLIHLLSTDLTIRLRTTSTSCFNSVVLLRSSYFRHLRHLP